MKIIGSILFALLLSGCSLFGGKTLYTIKPSVSEQGQFIGYEGTLFDSKNTELLEVEITKKADGSFSFKLKKRGVDASTASTAAGAASAEELDALEGILP